jgi:hypothetical protein
MKKNDEKHYGYKNHVKDAYSIRTEHLRKKSVGL